MLATLAVMLMGQFELLKSSFIASSIEKAKCRFGDLAMKKLRIKANNLSALEPIADAVLLEAMVQFGDCICGVESGLNSDHKVPVLLSNGNRAEG